MKEKMMKLFAEMDEAEMMSVFLALYHGAQQWDFVELNDEHWEQVVKIHDEELY